MHYHTQHTADPDANLDDIPRLSILEILLEIHLSAVHLGAVLGTPPAQMEARSECSSPPPTKETFTWPLAHPSPVSLDSPSLCTFVT